MSVFLRSTNMFIIGLSKINLDHLQTNHPILKTVADTKIFIFYSETEEALLEELVKHNIISQDRADAARDAMNERLKKLKDG